MLRPFSLKTPSLSSSCYGRIVQRLLCSSTDRIEGRASADATASFCERTNTPFSCRLEPSGWEVSAVGFGGYRIREGSKRNALALEQAWRKGVNVLDTSPNFNDGQSERAIGQQLRRAISCGDVRREEVVLMTKAGYIQGSMLRDAKSKPSAYEDLTPVSEHVWHCMAPDFIQHSLDTSLANLGVAHVDVLFLSNPEVFAKAAGEAQMYDRLASVFCLLEDCVAQGKIGYYGVASNSLGPTMAAGHAVSLDRLLRVARDAGGDKHHFQAIQYPLNIFEHAACDADRGESLINAAKRMGIWQFAQRSLNTVAPDRKLKRLAYYPVDSDGLAERVADAFQQAVLLELEFAQEASEELLAAIPGDARTLAEDLTSHTHLLGDVFVLEHYLDNTVIPAVEAVCDAVPRIDDEWAEWASKYRQAMRGLREQMVQAGQEHANGENAELAGILNSICPALKSSPNIAEKAIRLTLGTGVNCALVGMTQPQYVDDAIAAAAADPLSEADVDRILKLPVFVPRQGPSV